MALFHIVLLLLISAVGTFAGSGCPPRSEIYPCTCMDINLTKRNLHTTVVCFGLSNSDSLHNIVPALSRMEIDKFYVYDSFWAADDTQKVLPTDFLTLTNIKGVEIIDSTLSSGFACQFSLTCRNSITTTFKLINSSSSEKISTMCKTGRGSLIAWMACLSKLDHFQLSYGNLKSITDEFFPLLMPEMKVLNFSHNQIAKIDPNSFKNVHNLKSLDLSYNVIEYIDHTFGQKTELEYIDLSHNLIKMVGDLIPRMPKIRLLNFAYNRIAEFKYSDWQTAPDSLRYIDFTGNSIHCDCNLKWVNNTLPVHVSISGTCSTPEEYNESRIRVASRHMNERCDAFGNLGTKKKT